MPTAARARDPAESEPLQRYRAKRRFDRTPEPTPALAAPRETLSFVIQKHWASRLHYDFRLELDGVLLSWAVPKGPSFDPKDKRMAIHVEDHPVSYGGFEGTIPPGQYGAGRVIVWDRGHWEPVGDARAGLREGKLVFHLHGQKLAGLWELVRIAKPGDRQDPWMLFKKRDAWARPLAEYDVIAALPDSVVDRPLGPVEQREPRGNGHDGEGHAAPAHAAATSAAALPRAVKAALPAKLSPQLATLAKAPPAGGDWVCEVKFDGYRILARLERGRARLFTRNGHDWTDKLQPLAGALAALPLKSAWIDGEIVVLDERGVPNFNLLQNAFDAARTAGIVFFAFDLPYADGHDLRAAPLQARRALLQHVLDAGDTGDNVRFSAGFGGEPAQVLQSACAAGLEGVIAKRADAAYAGTRSDTWLKLKCQARQEFVIAGFTDRTGATGQVGSLLLAVHGDDGRLRYAGSVGTGWNAAAAADLHHRLAKLETKSPPFDAAEAKPGRFSRRAAGAERWVKPELVAEVAFAEWTPDGRVRHASFQGLRADKPAAAITRERAADVPGTKGPPRGAGARGGGRVGDVKVSNPERVIDVSTGLTKLDLVRYYESVADWMLPHLKARPVSLVRGPSGIGGQLFFQKHDDKLSIPGLRELDAALWPGHEALLEVPDANALVNAAQMNVIEFHTWNSTTKHIDQPDRVVFDLDPGEGVKWPQVQEAALLVRALLDELGLASWLKTSGGKGLHVVVPLTPRLDHDMVKDVAQAIVQHLARTIPSRFVAKSGPANRVGRIFVDYLRNSHGATTVAAFSARARPGLGVSMPVAWDDLPTLKSGAHWTIATAREHLSFQQADPWADYAKKRQTLAAAMKVLDLAPPKAAPKVATTSAPRTGSRRK